MIPLENTMLFKDISPMNISALLKCLGASSHIFEKNQFIFQNGDIITVIGIVLSGSVSITKDDYWGNQSILAKIMPGQIFGETYAWSSKEPLGVTVVSSDTTEILFLDIKKLLVSCSVSCEFHSQLIYNFLSVLAEKNLMLTRKLDHISQRSIRKKILSYLSEEAQKFHNSSFTIPFNRQQLADYLSVDRSALSNELCKLRDEGILTFHKNSFTLFHL